MATKRLFFSAQTDSMKTNKQTKKVFRCSDEIHEYITQILQRFVSFIQGKCVKPARAQSVPLRALRCACTSRRVAAVGPHPLTPPPPLPHLSPGWRHVVAGHPAVPGLRLQRAARKPPRKQRKQNNTTRQNTSTRVPTLSFGDAGEASARPEATHTGLFQAKSCTFFAGVVFFLVYCYFAAHS